MVSLPKLVSSLDFSKGERVFFDGDGEARGLTGVEGEGLPGVDGERSELRARLEAAFTGVRKPSLSYCTCGIVLQIDRWMILNGKLCLNKILIFNG